MVTQSLIFYRTLLSIQRVLLSYLIVKGHKITRQPVWIDVPIDTACGTYLEKYRESFIVWCRIPAPFVLRRLSLSTKRQKIGAELEKARAKRDEWERRVKALEASYEEAKKTEINDIVEAANITPEELAALIRKMKTEMPGSVTDDTEAEEENT
jgi:hypothetical protein